MIFEIVIAGLILMTVWWLLNSGLIWYLILGMIGLIGFFIMNYM